MKRLLMLVLGAGLVVMGLAEGAQAQGSRTRPGGSSGGIGARPAISPYLNLNRGGSSPAMNYYNLVRPQIDTARDLQQLQSEFNSAQTQQQQQQPYSRAGGSNDNSTGHAVRFYSLSPYFTYNPTRVTYPKQ